MAEPRTVLFVPFARASLLETLPLARALVAEGSLKPLYYVDPRHAKATLPILAKERFSAVGPDGAPFLPAESAAEPEPPGEEDEEGSDEAPSRVSPYGFLLEFARSLRHFRGVRRSARSLLARNPGICALVMVSDRKVGIETALVAAANERGIPTLVVPFATSFPEAIAETRYRDEQVRGEHAVSGAWRTFLARRHAGWVFRHKGQPLFFHHPGKLVAANWCGMMPANPWAIGGGDATRLTVDSERSRAMFAAQGIPAEKMVVTGRPSADDVARTLRKADPAAIRKELGVSEGKRLILCSVPPLAEHGRLPWDRHWQEIEFLFRALADTGASVVLSLHPRSEPAKYAAPAAAAGAVVARRRVYELLPACDLLVSAYSSIVAPAIALHKPVVVADFYGLDYPVYDAAPGTAVVRDRGDFPRVLSRLLTDAEFYASQRKAQEEKGHEWAILDGGCTKRVLEEMLRLSGAGSRR